MSFKTIFYMFIGGIIVFVAFNFYHNRKMADQELRLRAAAILEILDIHEKHSETIGTYYNQVARLSSDLSKEKSLSKELRETIKTMELELGTKARQIQVLQVQIDTLKSQGTAIVYVDSVGARTYKINEYKQGTDINVVLEHPSGDYSLSVAHDPISIEILTSRTKEHDIAINTVRFPGSPHIKLSSFEVVEVDDPRSWLRKFWDNTRMEVGGFAGKTAGITASIGYNNILAGPVITEEGTSLGIWYRIK
jgi:chaperonin cofactor prefoldin